MNAWMHNKDQRDVVSATRKRPSSTRGLLCTADGCGDLGPEGTAPPTDLYLEATQPTGEVAIWFDDAWWLELLKRWGDRALTIHILPSEAALLHPVVLHLAMMVERVAPSWRIIAYGYCVDVAGEAGIEAVATCAYDRVCLADIPRPGADPAAAEHALRIDDLFARVRRIQKRTGATRPALVRATSLPAIPALSSNSASTGSEATEQAKVQA